MTPRERAEALARSWWEVNRPLCVWHATYNRPTAVESSRTEAEAWSNVADVTAPLADDIARAIGSALAEQAAGEAERVREAVAREREACAQQIAEFFSDDAHKGHILAQYLRAISPAPAPVAAERTVIEAAQVGASWYAYDPETGYDTFETAEEAQRAAEASLDYYRDQSPEGWHESVGEIEWGMLVPYGEARQCDVVNAEDDPTVAANGWDYRCDYRLHSVRSAAVDALAAARKGGGK